MRTFHLLKTVPALNQSQVNFSPCNNAIYSIALEQESDDDTTYDSSFKTLDASDYSSIGKCICLPKIPRNPINQSINFKYRKGIFYIPSLIGNKMPFSYIDDNFLPMNFRLKIDFIYASNKKIMSI